MEEGAPRSKSMVGLNKCIVSLITILGFCLQPMMFAHSSPDYSSRLLMRLFVIDVSAYFGSIGVMILQTDHSTTDFRKFMNRISILLGTFASILELLILVPSFGWLLLFFWCICFVSVAGKSYQYLKTLCESAVSALVLASGDLKDKLNAMNGHLMKNFKFSGIFGAEKLKKLIRICRWTEHEAQNQNQIIDGLPV